MCCYSPVCASACAGCWRGRWGRRRAKGCCPRRALCRSPAKTVAVAGGRCHPRRRSRSCKCWDSWERKHVLRVTSLLGHPIRWRQTKLFQEKYAFTRTSLMYWVAQMGEKQITWSREKAHIKGLKACSLDRGMRHAVFWLRFLNWFTWHWAFYCSCIWYIYQ